MTCTGQMLILSRQYIRECLEAGVARLAAASAVSDTQSGGDSRQGEVFYGVDIFCHGDS